MSKIDLPESASREIFTLIMIAVLAAVAIGAVIFLVVGEPGLKEDETANPSTYEDQAVLPGTLEEEPVIPSFNEDEAVLPGTLEDEPVLPSFNEDEAVLPGTLEEELVLPGTLEEETVLPGTQEDEPVNPSTYEDGAVDPGLDEDGAVDPVIYEDGAVDPDLDEDETVNPSTYEDGAAAYQSGDYETAYKILLPFAENGHLDAQVYVGVMLQEAQGVEQNYAAAARWYQSAARHNHAYAEYNLGELYAKGLGVTQDDAMALRWFQRAHDQGMMLAAYQVGNMLRSGLGAPQDLDRAFGIYSAVGEHADETTYQELARDHAEHYAAALAGNSASQFQIGLMFGYGLGIEQKPEIGLRWLLKAAEQADPEHAFQLAHMLKVADGIGPYDGDGTEWLRSLYEDEDDERKLPTEAARWFEKAASQDHSGAQVELGVIYGEGRGVTENHTIALQWFERAAGLGSVEAQYRLGAAYAEGRLVEQDYAQAREWYEKAAAQNHTGARYQLGVIYRYGLGVAPDMDKALYWYRSAAAGGEAAAKASLGVFETLLKNRRGLRSDDTPALNNDTSLQEGMKAYQDGERRTARVPVDAERARNAG